MRELENCLAVFATDEIAAESFELVGLFLVAWRRFGGGSVRVAFFDRERERGYDS